MDESGCGSGPLFQQVLDGYVTRICEIYIDDLLVHGRTDDELLDNLCKILVRLCTNRITANPEKTELGLDEVEYVRHFISSEGTSFTPEKRLQVLEFPPPATQKTLLKTLLQFIGLVNYFRDHVPQMTEMVKPLRELIYQKKYKGSNKLDWTAEGRKAFDFCRSAVSTCIGVSQLNWFAREKECCGIYYGVKLFEDLLDNRYFILKTDLMNLTYI